MSNTDPVTVLCIYRVKDGQAEAFRGLVASHWSTLDRLGLVSSKPPQWYVTEDEKKRTCFVEIFEWKDGDAPKTAHELPEVMAIWEPMGALVEHMEFLDIEPIR